MSDDIETRLAAARARKAVADATLEAAAQLAAVEDAERDATDAETLAAQKGRRGHDWAAVHTQRGVVVVKRPDGAIFKRFQELTGDPSMTDIEKLVFPCVVHPDRSTFDRWYEERPAIATRCAAAIAQLAGSAASERAGKS